MPKLSRSKRNLPPSAAPAGTIAGRVLDLEIPIEEQQLLVTTQNVNTGIRTFLTGIKAHRYLLSLNINEMKQWWSLPRSNNAESGGGKSDNTGTSTEENVSSHDTNDNTENTRPSSSNSDFHAYGRGSVGEESEDGGCSFLVTVMVLDDNGDYIPLVGLCDTGSSYSFITPEALRSLNIKLRWLPPLKRHGVRTPISEEAYRAERFVEGRVHLNNINLKTPRVNFRLLPAVGNTEYSILLGWDFIRKQDELMHQLETTLGRRPLPSVCAALVRDKRSKEQKAKDKAALNIVQMNDDMLVLERNLERKKKRDDANNDGGSNNSSSWRQTSDEAPTSTASSSSIASASRRHGPQMQPEHVSRVGSGFSRPESTMTRSSSFFSVQLSTFSRRSTASTAMSSRYDASEYSGFYEKRGESASSSRSNTGFDETFILDGKDVLPEHAEFERSKLNRSN